MGLSEPSDSESSRSTTDELGVTCRPHGSLRAPSATGLGCLMVAILNDTVGQPFILTVLAVLAVVLFLVLLVLLIALATGFIADRRGRRRKIRMGSK